MKVCVIGAGLAGLNCADALTRSGFDVILIDKNPTIASRASGNPAGIFKPILTPTPTPSSRLSFPAFSFLLKTLIELESDGFPVTHSRTGLLQLGKTEEEQKRFENAIVQRGLKSEVAQFWNAETASEKLGYRVQWGGAFFPEGGWVDPSDLCSKLLSRIQSGRRPGKFRLELGQDWKDFVAKLPSATAVVFCTAEACREFEEFHTLRSQVIRGQLSQVTLEDKSYRLPFVVSFHEYCIPRSEDALVLGATHDRGDESTEIRSGDHDRLMQRIGSMLPTPWVGLSAFARKPQMRAGLRFSASDHLPKVSALPQTGKKLGRSAYCITALGSRGILWAPLLAELLRQDLEAEAGTEVDSDVLAALRVSS